jgi:hypothetical protein
VRVAWVFGWCQLAENFIESIEDGSNGKLKIDIYCL